MPDATGHDQPPGESRNARYLPLAIDLNGLACLVVGGGTVGTRKVHTLLEAGANVTVCSPELSPALTALVKEAKVTWRDERYQADSLKGLRLVVAATSDRTLNEQIGSEAEALDVWCCVAAPGDRSRLIFPAVHRHGDLTIAVNSGGASVRASCGLRDRIAALLGKREEPAPAAQIRSQEKVGIVYLVGAGPGAADLMTVRGMRLLRRADVIVVDSLLPRTFFEDLGLSTHGKTIEWLEERPHRRSQQEINRFLARAAHEGKAVVRLKNGDPLVFGRGLEEAEHLAGEGIPCEIVPGPSASTSSLTAAGLAPTYRESGRSFAVVTARSAGGGVNRSYPRADSLVILMGVAVVDEVAGQLVRDGWPADTPVAVLQRATLPWERRIDCTLADVARRVHESDLRSPAILVIGTAARSWGDHIVGPRILFTGLDPTNFRTLGRLLHWPALQVVRAPRGLQKLPEILSQLVAGAFDRVLFTDKVGVHSFFDALEEAGLDARVLAGTTVAAAGRDTVLRLREYGIVPDETTVTMETAGQCSILLVPGIHAPTDLGNELRNAGAHVTRLTLRRLVPHPDLGAPLPYHEAIYFVSPAGVRSYWNVYGERAFAREVWCLGDQTLARVEKLGFTGTIVNPRFTRFLARP